jgi:serine phosphatase RsbU (regulator of sigma subunit)
MAWLLIEKGANQGQRHRLEAERITLGRSATCDIAVPGTAVSRQHAQILHSQGKYYIEDLGSRNKTFLNDKELAPRAQELLRDQDLIKICDFVCSFHITAPSVFSSPTIAAAPPDPVADGTESTLYESPVSTTGKAVFDQQPHDNLKLILETSNRLSKTLEMGLLLPKIGDCMFQLFRQVDRCLVIMREAEGDLVPKMIKARHPQDENDLRFSRSIVGRCLESRQAFLSYDAASDDRLPTKSASELRIRSVMCVPLCTAEGEAFGVIQLDTRHTAKKFTPEHLKLLAGVAYQASIALENAKLYEHLLAREQVERDLELAGQMQRSILPDQLPQFSGYEFFAYYAAAHEVGGDYYDFIALPQQRLAVTLGDVVGKGISAALLMAKLSSDARFCLQTEADAGAAVALLSDLVYRHTNLTERFITFLAAVLDPVHQIATVVNAGNVLPLLYRRATREVLEAIPRDLAGLPLGIHRGQRYVSCRVDLLPGDCLLLFTDGVSDAVDVQNRPFQVEGVLNVLRRGGFSSAEGLGRKVIQAIDQHATGRSQYDDITLVCFGRTG